MMIQTIKNKHLTARLSPQGGVLMDATFDNIPIIRPYREPIDQPIDPLKSGIFPMVPVANRIENNQFTFDNHDYHLSANLDGEHHYIHGDGWLLPWQVQQQSHDAITMTLDVHTDIYCYQATQNFNVQQDGLQITLSVQNTGKKTLPFGLGLHPFFPLTPATTLTACAQKFWTAKKGFLPDDCIDIPDHLNFNTANKIPNQWVNNGYDGWDGKAKIEWPENNTGITIQSDMRRFFIYHPDAKIDPDFQGDYFCFEPMSHTANAHNLTGDFGLKNLAQGEQKTVTMILTPYKI